MKPEELKELQKVRMFNMKAKEISDDRIKEVSGLIRQVNPSESFSEFVIVSGNGVYESWDFSRDVGYITTSAKLSDVYYKKRAIARAKEMKANHYRVKNISNRRILAEGAIIYRFER